MVQKADAALTGYLAGHYDRARLVLRGVSDTDAALAALDKAVAALWRIPHPYEPLRGLPSGCAASFEDGLPVLYLAAEDGAGHIDQIAAAILIAADAEGLGGWIEPFPYPGQTSVGTDGPPAPTASGEALIRPHARHVSHGDLGLAVSDYGFLYSEGIRAMLAPLLDSWALVGYETCFAMYATREAATDFGRRIRREPRTGDAPRLWPLREHRSGMTLAELCTQMDASYEDLKLPLEKMERNGDLAVWQSDSGSAMVGLTDRGQLAMDGHLRRKAEKDLVVLEDIRPEQLRLIRHVCLRAVANRKRFWERDERQISGAALSDKSKWRLELENDQLYVAGMRAFAGPLEPTLVLGLETLHALHSAASTLPSALPRALPTDSRTLTAWWLHARPDGMPHTVIMDALGPEGTQVLHELEQGGMVTRTAAAGSTRPDTTTTYHLTETARRLMSERVEKLTEDMRSTFDGLSIEELGGARDGSWRIALNFHGADL